jgi:hypothetical protein
MHLWRYSLKRNIYHRDWLPASLPSDLCQPGPVETLPPLVSAHAGRLLKNTFDAPVGEEISGRVVECTRPKS